MTDHSKYVDQFLKTGIKVYTNQECADDMKLSSHNLNISKDLIQFQVGPWKILPAPIEHDVKTQCYVIYNTIEKHKTLYFTDTYFLRYKFKGINTILGEANYSSEIMENKLNNGSIHSGLRNRILSSHMSFEVFQDFLRANDLSQLRQIILCHLSNSNSNALDFKTKIQEEFLKETYVAESGLSVNLNKYAF